MYKRPKVLQGLSTKEVEYAKKNNLINDIIHDKSRSYYKIISKNLFTFFNFISLVIALILFTIGSYKNMLFLGVVFSNILIGVYQEIKAKKIIDKLNIISKRHIKCIRNGNELNVLPSDLALYDLVLLGRGDQIPTDCEIEAGECVIDYSILTGESDPINKTTKDNIFGSGFILEGNIFVRITSVGKDSYINKLQMDSKRIKESKSVLLKQVNRIIEISTFLIVPIAILLFFRTRSLNITTYSLINSIAAALIGMIPSGLVLLTSISLAAGVINLSKINVIVNDLSAIESLARIDTLCLDKTGTLTSGKMHLDKIIPFNENLDNCINYIKEFFKNNADNNSTLDAIRNGINYYEKLNIKKDSSVSFSSSRKWSAVESNGVYYCLGACSYITFNKEINENSNELSSDGNRVLFFAKTDSKILEDSNLTEKLIEPICFIVIKDEIRPDANETIKYFYDQDVNIKIISGDNINTIKNVANRVGILNNDNYLEKDQIKKENDFENINLFARVSPDDKKYIVDTLKKNRHVVGMCGDGINDLPALKSSDCSIAMGSGSEAVRSSAQIVLLKDKFSNVPEIVLEGRRVINNINLCASLFLNKTFMSFLLSLICAFFSINFPFQPIQLTLISSLGIGIPSFFYALEPNKNRVKDSLKESIITNSIPTSICIGLGLVFIKYISLWCKFNYEIMNTIFSYYTMFILFVSLYSISKPFTKLRKILLSSLVLLFTLVSLFVGDFFYFVKIDLFEFCILLALLCFGTIIFILIRRTKNKIEKL